VLAAEKCIQASEGRGLSMRPCAQGGESSAMWAQGPWAFLKPRGREAYEASKRKRQRAENSTNKRRALSRRNRFYGVRCKGAGGARIRRGIGGARSPAGGGQKPALTLRTDQQRCGGERRARWSA